MAGVPSPASTTPSTNAEGSSTTPSYKPHACTICQQRKVKCDRIASGCSTCQKTKVECVYRQPAPPRRRKRKLSDSSVTSRLRRYEELLRENGIDIESKPADETRLREESHDGGSDLPKTKAELAELHSRSTRQTPTEGGSIPSPNGESGQLIIHEGKSRYLENRLFTDISNELHGSKSLLDDSSDEDETESALGLSPDIQSLDAGTMLLGGSSATISLLAHHPSPIKAFHLWQLFMDRVNSLTRILHAPTFQQTFLNATTDLTKISKPTEALIFAVYTCAVRAMSESECMETFGDSKSNRLNAYLISTRQALINANFLKSSDLDVLRAFLLFLIAAEQKYDPRIIWILSGIAVRIAQRFGLHRDGTLLGLSIFETEMRRRLFFAICLNEGLSQKLAGAGGICTQWDTKIPMNLNDSELHPGMKEWPEEHVGATEMVFFLVKCYTCDFLTKFSKTPHFDGAWSEFSSHGLSYEDKMKAIDDFEQLMERKFVKNCDDSIPLHFATSVICRAVISLMRFLAHYSKAKDKTNRNLQDENSLFLQALKIVEAHILLSDHEIYKRYGWHTHVQYKPLLYILSSLSRRTAGPDVERAWTIIEQLFNFIPGLGTETKNSINYAICNLSLKAWDAYQLQGGAGKSEPAFITQLRLTRAKSTLSIEERGESLMFTANTSPYAPMTTQNNGGFGQTLQPEQRGAVEFGFSGFNTSASTGNYQNMMSDDMGWLQWDSFLQNPGMEGSGNIPF